jgi:hypothetical protein
VIITLQIREQDCAVKRLQATRYQRLTHVFPDFVNAQSSIHDLRPSAKKVRFVPEPEFHFRFPSVTFPKVAGQTRVIPILGTVGGLVAIDSFNRTPSWLRATPEYPRSFRHFAHLLHQS